MPIAQKFKALGAGNGFPHCLEKVDVSGYFQYKILTLDQAVFLYWSVASATATATCEFAYEIPIQKSIGPTDLIKEPKDRGTDIGISSYSEGARDPSKMETFSLAKVSVGVKIPSIYRIYQGSTEDETKFLGYSFGEIASAEAESHYYEEQCHVAYQGMIQSDEGKFHPERGQHPETESLTIGPSNKQIPVFKVTNTWTEYTISDPTRHQGTSADVTAIDFYTYPA
jgi:hypothetical protein